MKLENLKFSTNQKEVTLSEGMSAPLHEDFPTEEVTIQSYEVISDAESPEMDKLGIIKNFDLKFFIAEASNPKHHLCVPYSKLLRLSIKLTHGSQIDLAGTIKKMTTLFELLRI